MNNPTTPTRTGMLTIGDKFPNFKLDATIAIDKKDDNFKTLSLSDYKGKWKTVFFWPLDFTFVCPTEIAEFNKNHSAFADRGTILLGASCDSKFTHLAWRKDHADLKGLKFPMLADYNKTLSTELGILHKGAGAPLRATFIVDPEDTIRWVDVCDLSVGRSVKEVIRVLDALQTGELCPCGWEKGDPTLKVA
ncbi:MAG: Alkyl hydroperoxide reductase protein [Bacteriovoracaceae bacterium]|nr:Alkyl hydroperoxide reductase protein [Bacteriovoracaceae bacterium]